MTEPIDELCSATWRCERVDENHYDETVTPARLLVQASIAHPKDMKEAADVQMELDTGADMTVIPLESVKNMKLPSGFIAMEDFNGRVTLVRNPTVRLKCPSLSFDGEISVLVMNSPRGIIGRDILNERILILNGPAKCWCCKSKLCDVDAEQLHSEDEEVVQ